MSMIRRIPARSGSVTITAHPSSRSSRWIRRNSPPRRGWMRRRRRRGGQFGRNLSRSDHPVRSFIRRLRDILLRSRPPLLCEEGNNSMLRRMLLWGGMGFAGLAPAATLQSQNSVPPATASTVRAVLDMYCVTCHNQKAAVAGLMLDKVDPARAGQDPAVWEKVVYKLHTRTMPPPGRPRPDAASYKALITHLETELDGSAAAKPNPGRPAMR